MRECGGQRYPVNAALASQLLALVDGNRHARRGLDQQAALGEKPREQHPVPLLVRALGDQMLDALFSTVLKAISELTTAGAQTTTKALLLGRHRGPRLAVRHRQLIEGLPGACFRFAPGRQNDLLEGFAQFA